MPLGGRVLAVGCDAPQALASLSAADLRAVHPFRPAHNTLVAAGVPCAPDFASLPEMPFDAGVVALPRSRDRAKAWIAATVDRLAPGGWLIVDGERTDGIDAMHKALRTRLEAYGSVTKAHGRLIWGQPAATDFADWRAAPAAAEGYRTAPGVFSADHVDPGSRALAAALPPLAGRVADLGAGWGYLSAMILAAAPGPDAVDLVEADHDALVAARANVADTRARFHWADARDWQPEAPCDAVVMNPPFHIGRRPDPDLGRAFIHAAARVLRPGGALWMVANRHLPYEADLDTAFAEWHEAGGDGAFKLIRATRGRSARKGRR